MILGKSVENVLQIEFHSPRVYTRAIAFSFFFSPPHRNLFFTEFLEQFVTIPPVLSPVCNIDIFPTWSGIFNVFQKGKRAVRRFVIYLFTGGGFNYREYNNNCDFSRSPSSFRYFLFLFSTIYYRETYWHKVLLLFWIILLSTKNASLYSLCSIYDVTFFYLDWSNNHEKTHQCYPTIGSASLRRNVEKETQIDKRSLSLFLLPI